jgi:hypothetical protein
MDLLKSIDLRQGKILHTFFYSEHFTTLLLNLWSSIIQEWDLLLRQGEIRFGLM